MRIGYQEHKEFFVLRMENDVPKGVIARPFGTVEQALGAIEGLQPLYPQHRLTITGGSLFLPPR